MNSSHHHATRDHRFAYISTADISSWSRSTTKAIRPEAKTPRQVFTPVQNPCAPAPVLTVVHNPLDITIDSNHGPGKSTVTKEMEKCDKTAAIVDARINATDFINSKLAMLTSTVRSFPGAVQSNDGDDPLVWSR